MKTTVKILSNERLESEISAVYYRFAKEAPGVTPREEGLLGLMWEEFDSRYQEGLIANDTDWTERQEWEL